MKAVLIASSLLAPSIAFAHIAMKTPTPRTDAQKDLHCGLTGSARANVTTLLPGATITVTWLETINHPGWYRISFQPDGAIFGIPPPSVAAPNFPDVDQTGMTLPDGSIVLADRIADGTLSSTITLPNMECANCTLQLIQLMTDKPPYTVPPAASDDIYFQCADITLSNSAPPPMNDAGIGDGPGGGGGTANGGCSTRGDAGIASLLTLAGLAIRSRRRAAMRR